MSWESCIILLNSDSTGSFYSGDIVTGSTVMEFKKEQKIDHISFKVVGLSKAQWSRSRPTVPYIKIYSENKILFEYVIDVFADINGKKIRPGIQTFHFHFLIPKDSPSSFKSSIAEVVYFIKVEGQSKCMLSRKHVKTTSFTVLQNVNLNHLEEYLDPTFVEVKKTFMRAGSFSLCFKTFKGFSPKQYVQFEAIFTNNSKVRILKIKVTLIQKLKYTVSSGYANDEKKLHKVEHKKFSQTMTERCHFGMEIPQTVPSSINSTNALIDISYILRVEVIFAFHTTLTQDVPVTISTIPVMHNDFDEVEYAIK